ncbi:AAA family ATPase [Archangium gephyra]|nr:AAA family ATPase [Archangium gephyra]
MPSADHKLTLEELEQRFAKLKAPAASKQEEVVEPLRWEYRMAACVLSTFEPTLLRPLHPQSVREGALQHLMGDCEAVTAPDGKTRWTLRQGVRQAAIARLGSRSELLGALAANPPREPDLLQRMISDWLKGTARPLEEQGLEELSCTLQIVHWFRALVPELPGPGQVQRRLEWLQFMAPFQYLAGQGFCGRRTELQKLRDYVGVVDVSTSETVRRSLLEAFGAFSRKPLLIHGPGGMGKSTLLARFILQHAEADERIPFVYLDFDDPTLSLDNPVTLLMEIARQLHLQRPEMEVLARFRRLCADVTPEQAYPWRRLTDEERKPTTEALSALLDRLETVDERAHPDAVQPGRSLWPPWQVLTQTLGIALATMLRTQSSHRLPRVLLVLDTFEEVQFRGIAQVETLTIFLLLLQESCPQLRTVLCGRVPTEHLQADALPLTELEPEASRELLLLNGVEDREAIDGLVNQLGGNPLTLKLAADVVKREGSSRGGIQGLKTRRLFFFSAREAVIQGQLYQRILGHIHDPKVRKLAHPGLVVRRITPEIIAKVLAGPCELHLDGGEEVDRLFEEFKREVSLVFVAADQSLHHRTDVRRVMLEALKAEKPAQVREIHEAAVRFYEGHADPLSRAEEIYHRLALGEPPRQVEGRWMPGVEPYLGNALEELPPAARPFLASRLGLELPPRMWEEAELADWERNVESRVRGMLARGDASLALQVLRARKERTPGSPLYELETQTLQRLGKVDEALEVVEEGLAAATPMAGASSVPLLLLRAELATALQQHELAEEGLRHAEQIARRVGREDFVLQVLVARVRIGARSPEQWRERAAALQAFLADASDELLARHDRLARLAFGLVAGSQPRLLVKGLEVVGFGNGRTSAPDVRDVLSLLRRTGWRSATSAFEAGAAEYFLMEVLHARNCPPELGPWIARIFVLEGLPEEPVRSKHPSHWAAVLGDEGSELNEGLPGWIAQAYEPLRKKNGESPDSSTLEDRSPRRVALLRLAVILETMREEDADRARIPLLLVRAELASRTGDLALAEESLLQAAQLAQRTGQSGRWLQALTRRAQLDAATPEQWNERRASLARLLAENPDDVVYKNPRLARLGIGLVASAHPKLLMWGLKSVGLGGDGLVLLRVGDDIARLLRHAGWPRAQAVWYRPAEAERFLAEILASQDCPADLPAMLTLAFVARGTLELDTVPQPGQGDIIK